MFYNELLGVILMKKITMLSLLFFGTKAIASLQDGAILGNSKQSENSVDHRKNSVNHRKNTMIAALRIDLKNLAKDYDSSIIPNQEAELMRQSTESTKTDRLASADQQLDGATLEGRRSLYHIQVQKSRLKLMAEEYGSRFAKATVFNEKPETLKRLQEESFESMDEEAMLREIKEQQLQKLMERYFQASLQTPSNLSTTQRYKEDSGASRL